MYPVSSDFKEAVRRPHEVTLRCEVWRAGQFLRTLEPSDGTVEVDARRAVRRTCSVSVPVPEPTIVLDRQALQYAGLVTAAADYADLGVLYDTYGLLATAAVTSYTEVDSGLVPTTGFSDVTPYGSEIRLWRGITMEQSVPLTYAALSGWGQ